VIKVVNELEARLEDINEPIDVAANFLITQKTDIHRTFQKSVQSKGSVVSDKIK
jgi:hypothetical protein